MEKYCRAGQAKMTLRRKQIACWVPKATHTHTLTICNIHCFSTATLVEHTFLKVTVYEHCRCREMLKFWNKGNSSCSVNCCVGQSGEG